MKYLIILLYLITTSSYQSFSEKRFFEILDKNRKAGLYIVIPHQGNKMYGHYYMTTNDKLYRYYLDIGSKSAVNYKDFLEKLFAKKITLVDFPGSGKYVSFIKENVSVTQEFKKHGLKYIKDKYLKFLKDEWRNKFSDADINNTLIKIMVDNGYIVYFSEYSGFYVFKDIKHVRFR